MDTENGKKFIQTFRSNMSKIKDPIVVKCTLAEKKKGDYTKITFRPDLDKFNMDKLDEDRSVYFHDVLTTLRGP